MLDAGLKVLREGRTELFYFTLSDYVQHRWAPGSREADAFMRAVDERVGEFVGEGAVVAVTGDHVMSDKANG